MREKTKFKTVEEISLVEFESHVQYEGQCIVVMRFSAVEGGLKTKHYTV